jgi:hypothetical protein
MEDEQEYRFTLFSSFERDMIFYALQLYSAGLREGELADSTVKELQTEIAHVNSVFDLG